MIDGGSEKKKYIISSKKFNNQIDYWISEKLQRNLRWLE